MLTDPLVRYRKPLVVATCLLFSFIILMLASLAFLDIRERRRQRDALALQNAYLSALHDTAIGLIGRLEFNELISSVLSRAGELTGTQNGFLYLFHPQDNAQLYSRLQDELKERHRAEQALQEANQALERLASLDGLTQISNRRRFDERLRGEWKRLSRSRAPLALVLADVDFFKRFNDTYGHQAGDECLQAVARTLAGHIYRPADMAARYGGEEFALLLPETDAVGAHFVARRVCAAVEALKIPHAASEAASHVTVSLGVACLSAGPDVAPTLLIQLADEALYDAKTAGRNRVVLQDVDGRTLSA